MYKGRVTEPVLRGLGIPHHVVDRVGDAKVVEDAVRESQLARSPVVVLLRHSALFGEAS